MNTRSLRDLIGARVLGVLGTYSTPEKMGSMVVSICGVEPLSDKRLRTIFPKGHQLKDGQWVTLHLDNRTGVSDYDADLKVYRLSFKGKVIATSAFEVMIDALEYQVAYGMGVVKSYQAPDYAYPLDTRRTVALPTTPLSQVPAMDDSEYDNKIGVLLTYAPSQPHTTVMAFLSSVEDDIFFITFPSTFKSLLLKRDNRCYFAIDSRATFTFEQAIEWNYSIIRGEVYTVPKPSMMFDEIRERFVAKNPWEVGFFSHPEVEMYHLKAANVVCPRMALD